MGIDARIVLKVKSDSKPTESQLKDWSWRIAEAIGANKFFIRDGLPPAEYRVKADAWHAAFRAHPEYAAFGKASHPERSEIHARMCADIGGEPPQKRRRAIDFTQSYGELDHEDPALEGKVYEQDGDDVTVGDGEWMLEVSLWSRYYGVGYERGDLLTICAVAEWCEANIPNAVVYYGGDSSGVCAEPFDAFARMKLRRHMYSQRGRDYFQRGIESRLKSLPPVCSLCPDDGPRFSQYGSGQEYAAVSCAGCGENFETRDAGVTWTKLEKERT